MTDFIALLRSREIPLPQLENYKKWLRYFYDFHANYLDTDDKPEKVKLFLEKLRSKNQTPAQCQQAARQGEEGSDRADSRGDQAGTEGAD